MILPALRFASRIRAASCLGAALCGLLAAPGAAQVPAQPPGPVQVLTLACEDKLDFPNVLGEGQEIETKKPGVSIEFVQRLGEELGLQVVIKRLPWKRALELELARGAIDGLFPASYRKDREVFGAFPLKDGKIEDARCMFVSAYCFYKLRASPLAWDGRSLRNLGGPIGASRGYSVVGDLQQMGYAVQESDDLRKDLVRLSLGWLGSVAALEPAGDFLLEGDPKLSHAIVKVQPPISTKHFFLMLSHAFVAANPELAQKLWDKCRELREREYPRILRKYVGR